jgi:hypothetical protein
LHYARARRCANVLRSDTRRFRAPACASLLAAAHPDYLGSALLLLGAAALLLLGGDGAPVGATRVLQAWLALYAASAMAEEGYALAGGPPQPPLRPGACPFWDSMTRKPVRAGSRGLHATLGCVCACATR